VNTATNTLQNQPPMVPNDVDLRSYTFFQLDVQWLTKSEFVLFASGDAVKATLMLMAESWHQVPAASLPNDERMLAHHAGLGTGKAAAAAWAAIRDEVMHEFELCSDGRLYSRTLAPKALAAWEGKRSRQSRTEKARAAKAEIHRAPGARVGRPATTSVTEPVTAPVTENATGPVTGSRGEEKRGEERTGDNDSGLDPWDQIALERAAAAVAPAPGSGQAADHPDQAGLEPSTAATPIQYAFEEGVIRLNAKDLATWKARYPNLDLEAELVSLTRWAADEVAKTGGSWFHPVQGALAKRNRAAKERSEQIRIRAEAETKQLGKRRMSLV
jgi:hypothetical protein